MTRFKKINVILYCLCMYLNKHKKKFNFNITLSAPSHTHNPIHSLPPYCRKPPAQLWPKLIKFCLRWTLVKPSAKTKFRYNARLNQVSARQNLINLDHCTAPPTKIPLPYPTNFFNCREKTIFVALNQFINRKNFITAASILLYTAFNWEKATADYTRMR